MPTSQSVTPVWRKASRTHQSGECVEVADFRLDIAVRDSKDPDGPMLQFNRAAFTRLAARINAGELDI